MRNAPSRLEHFRASTNLAGEAAPLLQLGLKPSDPAKASQLGYQRAFSSAACVRFARLEFQLSDEHAGEVKHDLQPARLRASRLAHLNSKLLGLTGTQIGPFEPAKISHDADRLAALQLKLRHLPSNSPSVSARKDSGGRDA